MLRLKTPPSLGKKQNLSLLLLHVLVIAGAITLVLLISFDTFRNVSFLGDPTYLKAQFWICMLFLVDIAVEFFMSPKNGAISPPIHSSLLYVYHMSTYSTIWAGQSRASCAS